MINNIIFFAASASKSKTILEKSIRETLGHLRASNYIEVYVEKDNKKSLAAVYNGFVEKYKDYITPDTAVVFTHDDAYINCSDIHERLTSGFKSYDVIGVAGSKSANIKSPALWHLMSDRADHVGAAAHPIVAGDMSKYFISSFGPMPSRALLIDGLFIATTGKVLDKVKFDESNPARFHYYDLSFSLDCNKAGFKIGVCDIPIIHMSPGLSNPDPEWKSGEDWFINKWG
jgi:hypothetical protein